MPLVPIELPPGMYANGTDLEAKGRWTDGNLVRWYEGVMRPMGGWRQRSTSTFAGIVRGAIAWAENAGDRWIGFGTAAKLYVSSASGTITDITPVSFASGSADAAVGTGYGNSFYGLFEYGTPRPDVGTVTPATTWSLDTWGEYLVGCSSSDGDLYEWQLSTGTPAQTIANAPTGCTSLVVSNERSLMAIGAGGNPRKVQWSALEDNTSWTESATNQAGSFTLTTTGTLKRGIRVRGELLFLTDDDVHVARYVGPPFVYEFERVGTGGLVANNAVVPCDDFAVWMGSNGFFVYDGRLRPLSCEVSDYVFGDMNATQLSKISAWRNADFNEVWWHYPSSTSDECDRYVIWNYALNCWYYGTLARTSGIDRGTFANPILFGTDTYIYEHGVQFDYDGATPYAESGPIEIARGDRIMMVNLLVSDENTLGDVTATFKTRYYPTSTESSFGPYSLAEPTSVRFSGRQVKMRVTGNTSSDWRVGKMRLETTLGGKR